MSYSLIIPIYNEDRTLPQLIESLYDLDDKNIEVIIIDDGSNDSTKDILRGNNQFVIKRNEKNLGKGASIKKGVKHAKNKNIILMDGDLEVDINDIPKLILNYESNKSDVIAGVRWKNKNVFQNRDINTIGNFIINLVFNILFNSKLNDVLCCVKILSKKKFKSLDIQSQGFDIEIETMAKLVINGDIIEELKVNYNRRTTQEGKKLKLSDSWIIIWTMFKIRFKKP
jgi:Glycosyltransferases, probably involved in cell wall biogenesis